MPRLRGTLISMLATATVIVAPAPGTGVAADPLTVAGPGVCNGRSISLAEGEKLEERTLYFHGNAPVGNLDGAQDAQLGGSRLTMSEAQPTGSTSRTYLSRPVGVLGDPAFPRDQHQGYWLAMLGESQRIVCAGAKVFATTATGRLTVQLWIDAHQGSGSKVTRSATAAAPPNQVSAFSVNYGALDITAGRSLVVQLNSEAPGALAHYDSTAHPSHFNYVIVVPAAGKSSWSSPTSLTESPTVLASGGERVHAVGRTGGRLVHRSSEDGGATWSPARTIGTGEGWPAQYGALAALGDTVYLLTVPSDPGPLPAKDVSFRKSTDNGVTWSPPVQITVGHRQRLYRVSIAVSGDFVHVVGLRSIEDEGSDEAWYFRSADRGETWGAGMLLDDEGGFGGIDLAVDGSTVHVSYAKVNTSSETPDKFETHYVRSTDDGRTFSPPLRIGGEPGIRETRTRIEANDGRVVVSWSADSDQDPLGWGGSIKGARSADGGETWTGVETFAKTAQANNHQDMQMVGPVVHLAWGRDRGEPGPVEYRFSTDYGATWSDVESALALPGNEVMAWNLRADGDRVHLSGFTIGTGQTLYTRRPAPTQA